MRNFILIIIIFFLPALNLAGQNIYEIQIKKSPPPPGPPPICPSPCEECGKLIFITFLSNLKFVSELGNIKEQKVVGEMTMYGYEKFTYHVVTKALPIQHIIIKGPNLSDYDLTVTDLEPVACQEFIINTNQTGSFFINTNPQGASITIEGEPQFKEVTPFFIKNHPTGVFKVKLEKVDYYPVDTTITILPVEPNKLSEIMISLRPKYIITSQPEPIRQEIKKHGRNQGIWGGTALVAAGAGGYLLYDSGQKYQKYLKTTDNSATGLHKTVDLYDKLGPALLVIGGFCGMEFVIQSAKKGKDKQKLNIVVNGSSAQLMITF